MNYPTAKEMNSNTKKVLQEKEQKRLEHLTLGIPEEVRENIINQISTAMNRGWYLTSCQIEKNRNLYYDVVEAWLQSLGYTVYEFACKDGYAFTVHWQYLKEQKEQDFSF